MSDSYAAWIGPVQTRRDYLTERLVASYRASLGPHLADLSAVPLGIHWCLSPDIEPSSALGEDGHPRKGGFLPPIPLRRRMWAGGEVQFYDDLVAGAEVTRVSRVQSVTEKQGRSGPLAFVAVEHDYQVDSRTLIKERHDIVYREGDVGGAATAPRPESAGRSDVDWTVDATSVLLFRYSALTFNGHRIHYDEPYARTVEKYAGLVIHGPLQATLLLNIAAAATGRRPARFAYRGVQPMIAPQSMHVRARIDGAAVHCWTENPEGRVGMTAQADFT